MKFLTTFLVKGAISVLADDLSRNRSVATEWGLGMISFLIDSEPWGETSSVFVCHKNQWKIVPIYISLSRQQGDRVGCLQDRRKILEVYFPVSTGKDDTPSLLKLQSGTGLFVLVAPY